MRGELPSPAIIAMSGVNDTLLFVALRDALSNDRCFRGSTGENSWLSKRATVLHLAAAFVPLTFIVIRGLSFPDPTVSSTPWYLQPGFIAGIPAVPWMLPFLLGVLLIRRAGDNVPMKRGV